MNSFWVGFIIGGLTGIIISFIIEYLCIVAGRSDIDTWTYSDKPNKPQNSHVDDD